MYPHAGAGTPGKKVSKTPGGYGWGAAGVRRASR
jgi:hypothetical protein